MAEGEIDVGEFDDFHGGLVSVPPGGRQGKGAREVIRSRYGCRFKIKKRAGFLTALFLAVLAGSSATLHAGASQPLLIAPHISGVTFCKEVVEDNAVSDEETAASICTAKHSNAADRISALLDSIGPVRSASGNYELGYTLNLPLMRFFRKTQTGGWVLDDAAIDNEVKIIHDVHRPVVVYLSANHFTDGGLKLSDELARDPANLMWTKDGPLQAYRYFIVALHAWTLVDPDARITAMRRQSFSAVLDAICRLDGTSRDRIAGVSVLGEVHQLWANYNAGQGYDAGFDVTDYSPKATAGFHAFLAARFGNIDALNRMAGSAFRSFADVAPPSKDIQKEHLNNFFEHLDAYAAGFVPIQGWAYDPSGEPVRLAIFLDGIKRASIVADLNRSDVPEANAKVSSPNVGWRFNLDYRRDVPGVHTLEVFRILRDGQRVKLTRRGLTVVPRDRSPALPLPSVPVAAVEASPNSTVLSYVDGPAPLTPLFYNPIAELWLAFRNKTIKEYIGGFAAIVDRSCLSPRLVFSHQLTPELNSSWDSDLMAVNASQDENSSYHQGVTLYGGAAFGQAFLDWEKAKGWPDYAVSEMHPRTALSLDQFDAMFEAHRKAHARFVAPYFLSIAPRRLVSPALGGLSLMMIAPNNHQLGSDTYYAAITDIMTHH